jgi:hypothetical protein
MTDTKEWALNILKEIKGCWDNEVFSDYNGDPEGTILTNEQYTRINELFEDIEEYIRLKEDLSDKNMN